MLYIIDLQLQINLFLAYWPSLVLFMPKLKLQNVGVMKTRERVLSSRALNQSENRI